MLSIEEKAKQDWLMESMKTLLANAGLKVDTTIIDEAKAEQEKIEAQKTLIEEVIEAQQVVADIYNPQLKTLREEMKAFDDEVEKKQKEYLLCCSNSDTLKAEIVLKEKEELQEKSLMKLGEVKEMIELITLKAREAEVSLIEAKVVNEDK